MKRLSYSLFLISILNLASPVQSLAGEVPSIDRDALAKWVDQIHAVQSPFQDYVFDWSDAEKGRDLPSEVNSDPDKTFVSVEKPLQETIALENQGDVEKGVTYGLEIYSKINATIEQVMETVLFRWGKPIGKTSGATYPFDSVFGYRVEALSQLWGESSYLNKSIKTHGGIAKDIQDELYFLVRPANSGGYDLAAGFVKAAGTTTTKTYFMLSQIRPLADGTVSYKISGRQMGQSYTQLGLEFGRKNFGFNRDRIHNGQKEVLGMIEEYKRTGKIHERVPGDFYNQDIFY